MMDVKKHQLEAVTFDVTHKPIKSILESKPKWRDAEYRQEYMECATHQTIAWQIKINREKRSLTQANLAKLIGTTQSGISRAEDIEYGKHNLATLLKIANAFDCALMVNFVSYSELAYQSHKLSEDDLYASAYSEESSSIKFIQDQK